MSDSDRSSWRPQLEKQAVETIDNETTAVELVSQLDFGYIEHNDQYVEWHASTPLLPMVRTLSLKEVEDYTTSELHRYLETHPEHATALGFDDIPAQTTFGRTWHVRFDDVLKHTIEYSADEFISELLDTWEVTVEDE